MTSEAFTFGFSWSSSRIAADLLTSPFAPFLAMVAPPIKMRYSCWSYTREEVTVMQEKVMSEQPTDVTSLIAKMRTNTEKAKRKVWAKPLRLSRKKVPKARKKKT